MKWPFLCPGSTGFRPFHQRGALNDDRGVLVVGCQRSVKKEGQPQKALLAKEKSTKNCGFCGFFLSQNTNAKEKYLKMASGERKGLRK